MDKDELIPQIQAAFSKVEYLGDSDLTVHPLGLDEIFYQQLKGKHWTELDAEQLNIHHDCIGVLTANGFAYYIAAFLIEDIKSNSNIGDQMIWDFSSAVLENKAPILGISGRDWLEERVGALSPDQKTSLIAYFNYLRILLQQDNVDETQDECSEIDLIVEAISEI